MSEKYLYFCRHGHRQENGYHNFFNPKLTSLGIAQSKLLAKEIKKYHIDKIIVSPYIRTLETADCISKYFSLSLNVDYCVAEWLNASWMNQQPLLYTEKEVKEHYSMAHFSMPLVNIHYKYPESLKQFKKRCEKVAVALDSLKGSTLIVTHGQVLSEVCASLTNRLYNEFPNDVCCLTILKKNTYQSCWEIILNGNVTHMTKYIKLQ